MPDEHWINGYPRPIANPMSPYPSYHDYRKSWGINALGSVVVEVEDECGTCGVGEGAGEGGGWVGVRGKGEGVAWVVWVGG